MGLLFFHFLYTIFLEIKRFLLVFAIYLLANLDKIYFPLINNVYMISQNRFFSRGDLRSCLVIYTDIIHIAQLVLANSFILLYNILHYNKRVEMSNSLLYVF
jgi:hypothetical protein